MKSWAARDSDGSLSLFWGTEPESYRVDGPEHGGRPSVAWRAGRGCAVVAALRREQFGDVRCGECREVGGDRVTEMRALPNAVKQTTPTNCFRACVATVLGLLIDEVPEACDGAKWDWDAFQDWLAPRGLQAIEIYFGNGGTIYPVRVPVTCILTGPSPRECTTGKHAVVGRMMGGPDGFELLHDPHQSDAWIEGEPTHAVFFVGLR